CLSHGGRAPRRRDEQLEGFIGLQQVVAVDRHLDRLARFAVREGKRPRCGEIIRAGGGRVIGGCPVDGQRTARCGGAANREGDGCGRSAQTLDDGGIIDDNEGRYFAVTAGLVDALHLARREGPVVHRQLVDQAVEREVVERRGVAAVVADANAWVARRVEIAE